MLSVSLFQQIQFNIHNPLSSFYILQVCTVVVASLKEARNMLSYNVSTHLIIFFNILSRFFNNFDTRFISVTFAVLPKVSRYNARGSRYNSFQSMRKSVLQSISGVLPETSLMIHRFEVTQRTPIHNSSLYTLTFIYIHRQQ
jgi:hypothetical protein